MASQRHCEYGKSPDGRRKESIHRARLDSAFHKALLQGLLDKLRHGKDIYLNTLIRSDATLEDLTTYLSNTPPQPMVKVETPTTLPPGHDELCQDLGSPQTLLDTQSMKARMLHPACGSSNIPENRRRISLSLASVCTTEVEPCSQGYEISDNLSHPCLQQPLNVPTGHRLITALVNDFLYACQQALSLGIPENIVLGSRSVNLETALVGHHSASSRTPSVWTCSLQQSFEGLDVFVRLAFVHCINRYMRVCTNHTPVRNVLPLTTG